MASEDSQLLNVAMISSSLRRRLPPRFIGALKTRASSMPAAERCRPDRTSSVIAWKIRRSSSLEPLNTNRSKNGKTRSLGSIGFGDFVIEDTVTAASHRANAEDRTEKQRRFFTDLRHVERQRDAPWKSTVTLSTDWDVEASLSIDESRDPVAQVIWDPIQPVRGTGPFLLIVRTGRIITTHVGTQTDGCDMDEYRRILGVSSI
jgi:hypothetical protein